MMGDFLGIDLAVVPHFVAHDAAEVDLTRQRKPILGLGPRGGEESFDLGALQGRENLAQALILRLLTPRGSLAALGHAAYGSRLHELIGQPKNGATRNLCRAYVLAVVAQEPRVHDRAVALEFLPESEQVDSFVFELSVQPSDGSDVLGLSLEVQL